MRLGDLIKQFLDFNILGGQYGAETHSPLPDDAVRALDNIETHVQNERDNRKIQLYVSAHCRILNYFRDLGYNPIQIDKRFVDLQNTLRYRTN